MHYLQSGTKNGKIGVQRWEKSSFDEIAIDEFKNMLLKLQDEFW